VALDLRGRVDVEEEGKHGFPVFREVSARITRGSNVLGERGEPVGRMADMRVSERAVNRVGGLVATLELPRTPWEVPVPL
jgi:hypothetical protein